jgi:hypothetical protein
MKATLQFGNIAGIVPVPALITTRFVDRYWMLLQHVHETSIEHKCVECISTLQCQLQGEPFCNCAQHYQIEDVTAAGWHCIWVWT